MKKNVFLVLASMLVSGAAFANVSEVQCYLYQETQPDNYFAITSTELAANGTALVTEADSMSTPVPESTRFSFKVKVEYNVITSMRLEDKKTGIVTEQTGLRRDSYMGISLQSGDMVPVLECFLNII
jgi:hypothetical protein